MVGEVAVHDAKANADNVMTVLFSKPSAFGQWTVPAYVASVGADQPFKPALDSHGYLVLADSQSAVTQGMTTLGTYLRAATGLGVDKAGDQVAQGPITSDLAARARTAMLNDKQAGYSLSIAHQPMKPLQEAPAIKGADGSVIGFGMVVQQMGLSRPGGCLVQDHDGHYYNPQVTAGSYKTIQMFTDLEYMIAVGADGKVRALADDDSTIKILATPC